MYNGRRRHIQTEPIRDQSVKEESVHGHGNGESALRRVENKVPSDKKNPKPNTWQKEKCTRSETASARHKKKNQCNVTFGSTVVN